MHPAVNQEALINQDWLGYVAPSSSGIFVDNYLLLIFGGIPYQVVTFDNIQSLCCTTIFPSTGLFPKSAICQDIATRSMAFIHCRNFVHSLVYSIHTARRYRQKCRFANSFKNFTFQDSNMQIRCFRLAEWHRLR